MNDNYLFSPNPAKVWAQRGRTITLKCGVSITDAGQELKHVTYEVAGLIKEGLLLTAEPASEPQPMPIGEWLDYTACKVCDRVTLEKTKDAYTAVRMVLRELRNLQLTDAQLDTIAIAVHGRRQGLQEIELAANVTLEQLAAIGEGK